MLVADAAPQRLVVRAERLVLIPVPAAHHSLRLGLAAHVEFESKF
jgi:hypothetical protein